MLLCRSCCRNGPNRGGCSEKSEVAALFGKLRQHVLASMLVNDLMPLVTQTYTPVFSGIPVVNETNYRSTAESQSRIKIRKISPMAYAAVDP